MAGVMTIGIAGGTGSGKTTITRRIIGEFAESVTVINYDNYYKAHNEMTYEQRSKLNYDHPDAFDTELFLQDLRALKQGKCVEGPTYDFTIHNRHQQLPSHLPYIFQHFLHIPMRRPHRFIRSRFTRAINL